MNAAVAIEAGRQHNSNAAMSDLALVQKAVALAQFGTLVPLLTACTISHGIADFGKNLSSQPHIAFGESQRVAAGQYSSPTVDPWDDRGAYVIAFEYIDDEPHLAMRLESGSQGCDTGVAYSRFLQNQLVHRVQLIAYQGGEQPAPLHFVDHDCTEYGQPIPYGSLPEMMYTNPPGYLVKVVVNPATASSTTQYWVVDPWNATTRVLASNVSWYSVLSKDDQVIGVIDNGHFRVFDGHQQLLSDVGTAVTELLFRTSLPSGPFFAVDGGVLREYQSTSDTAPVDISQDACKVSDDGNGALLYFSPCSSRQLLRYRLDTKQLTVIDSGVSAVVSSSAKPGTTDSFLLYTKPSPQGGADLWIFSPDASPAVTISNFSRLYDWAPPPALEILALANANADTGQLVRYTGAGVSSVLDSVSVKFAEPGILANFDPVGSLGDLYYPLHAGGTPQLAATGVPWVAQVSSVVTSTNPDTESYGAAIVTHSNAQVGDLELMRLPHPDSPGPETPVTLASGITPGKVEFFQEMAAIGYIGNWNGTLQEGHLAVHEMALDAFTDISDGVREFQEVTWPSEGIMYVIPNGDRAGIWFAKAN